MVGGGRKLSIIQFLLNSKLASINIAKNSFRTTPLEHKVRLQHKQTLSNLNNIHKKC